MSNLSNVHPSEEPGRWGPVPDVTVERLELLVQLMLNLRGFGRGSVLYLDGTAEPVLSVPVLSRRRALAVLVVQERGGWSYLWDAVQKAPVGAVRVAAERIAGVR